MEPKIVTLKKGDPVMETLIRWCKDNGVAAATLSALGAVEHAEIGFYDLPTKSYKWMTFAAPHEVVSMTGNISMKEGEPFVHAHISLSDDACNMKGGHLKEAVVAVTLECTITPLNEGYIRSLNNEIGLYLLPHQ